MTFKVTKAFKHLTHDFHMQKIQFLILLQHLLLIICSKIISELSFLHANFKQHSLPKACVYSTITLLDKIGHTLLMQQQVFCGYFISHVFICKLFSFRRKEASL